MSYFNLKYKCILYKSLPDIRVGSVILISPRSGAINSFPVYIQPITHLLEALLHQRVNNPIMPWSNVQQHVSTTTEIHEYCATWNVIFFSALYHYLRRSNMRQKTFKWLTDKLWLDSQVNWTVSHVTSFESLHKEALIFALNFCKYQYIAIKHFRNCYSITNFTRSSALMLPTISHFTCTLQLKCHNS